MSYVCLLDEILKNSLPIAENITFLCFYSLAQKASQRVCGHSSMTVSILLTEMKLFLYLTGSKNWVIKKGKDQFCLTVSVCLNNNFHVCIMRPISESLES